MSITSSGNGENTSSLSEQHIYVALVTKHFVSNEKCLAEVKKANLIGSPMFALIKLGTKIPDWFDEMNWINKIFFNDENMTDSMQKLTEIIHAWADAHPRK